MDCITVRQTSEKWGVTLRRAQVLIKLGSGAVCHEEE